MLYFKHLKTPEPDWTRLKPESEPRTRVQQRHQSPTQTCCSRWIRFWSGSVGNSWQKDQQQRKNCWGFLCRAWRSPKSKTCPEGSLNTSLRNTWSSSVYRMRFFSWVQHRPVAGLEPVPAELLVLKPQLNPALTGLQVRAGSSWKSRLQVRQQLIWRFENGSLMQLLASWSWNQLKWFESKI